MSKEKTDNIKRGMMDRSKMHPNPLNPNEMQDKEFNLLCDNIQRVGLTDPILVIPHPEIKTEFMIIGGEHRWRAADLLGIDSVPYTLIDDPDFNMDDQKFQIVRHNIIHGKMSASKFMDLYSSLSEEYEEDIAAELFGFTDEEEFRKLIKATASSLPKDMQSDFVQAAKDINTIDDLSKLLNHMFATYGDTLNHGYMIMDYGGKDSLWLRMTKAEFDTAIAFAGKCRELNRTADAMVAALLKYAINDPELLVKLATGCPVVDIPDEAKLATLDYMSDLQ